MKIDRLVDCFDSAIDHEKEYVAIMVKIPNCIKPEIIIQHKENLLEKIQYYRNSYNSDCELNSNKSVKLIACTNTNKLASLDRWVKSIEA